MFIYVLFREKSSFNRVPKILFSWKAYTGLTYWGRDKMVTIFQVTFCWMKTVEFLLIFHWSLFPRVQFTIFQHWLRWWLGTIQVTSHHLNQRWLVYWCIYASLGLNGLNPTIRLQTTFMTLHALYWGNPVAKIHYFTACGIWMINAITKRTKVWSIKTHAM